MCGRTRPVSIGGMRRTAILSLVLAGLVVTGTPARADAAGTLFKGAFTCGDGIALPGARVELWQHHYTWLPKVEPNIRLLGVGRTDATGAWAFRVGGEETNLFVRLVLSSEETEVRSWLWSHNWFTDTQPNQNDKPVQDYGFLAVRGTPCELFRGFRTAALDYRAQTGGRPPFGESVVRSGAPNAGVPWTNYDVVWWPDRYPVGNGALTAKHEYAHQVRHVLDGTEGHWLNDVRAYLYPQHHSATSCRSTNPGFAFNEGWAEYWAGEPLGTPCPDRTNWAVEKNVAAALADLQVRCGKSRGDMVRVLLDHPGRIHDLPSFQSALACGLPRIPRPPKQPRPSVTQTARVQAKVITTSAAANRRLVREMQTAQRRATKALVEARRVAATPVTCPERPCLPVLQNTVALGLARAAAAQATAVRSTLGFLTDRRRLRAVLGRSPVEAHGRIDAAQKLAERRAARATMTELRRAARAVAALPGASSSALAKQAIAALGAGAGRGIGAVPLADPFRVVPVRTAATAPDAAQVVDLTGGPGAPPAPQPPAPQPPTTPPPSPDPPAPERSPSTLTLTRSCDTNSNAIWTPGNPDGTTTFSGMLTPAVAGSPVVMRYEREGMTTIEHAVTTDADGHFTDFVTADEYSSGYGAVWRASAHFAGDATRLPAQSCTWTARAIYP